VIRLTCARDGCENPVLRRPGQPGRPQIYCSPACRPSYGRSQMSVEVDRDESEDAEHGRDWNVRLRRGERVLVVQRGIGRFSATAFAAELSAMVAGTTTQLIGVTMTTAEKEGDTIE
jgi:hypothetical protein